MIKFTKCFLITRILSTKIVSFRRFRTMFEGEKTICVNNYNINYLKVGNGSHHILCLPGLLGSILTDFTSQISAFDYGKFSIIVWDPPGYGRSQPPDRDFSARFLERDATIAAEMMNLLNITKYSILGWSDGGVTGLMMAAKNPDNIRKLVVWGANAYITQEDVDIYESIRNISNWSPNMRNTFASIYGLKKLQEYMNQWVDSMIYILKEQEGDICRQDIPKIIAPTFVLHGAKDPLVPDYHVEYLNKYIKNSKVYVFENGKHNIHIKYRNEFNKLVNEFLHE